jgi:hypothetical protein
MVKNKLVGFVDMSDWCSNKAVTDRWALIAIDPAAHPCPNHILMHYVGTCMKGKVPHTSLPCAIHGHTGTSREFFDQIILYY